MHQQRNAGRAEQKWSGAFHRQVRIEHDGRSAEVDEAIAPMILALWRRGFATLASCENVSEWPSVRHGLSPDLAEAAYVTFTTGRELDRFVEIVRRVTPVLTEVRPDASSEWTPELQAKAKQVGGVFGLLFHRDAIAAVAAETERTA